jgi:phage tail sheath protein FI
MPAVPVPPYPGVTVYELPSSVHTITGVSTSVTAFVGTAPTGPVNQLKRVQSFAEYSTWFGGVDPSSEMSYAVMQFFLNGGSDSWVIRVAPGATTATLNILDSLGNPSLDFTAINGGTSGNGTAIAIDWPSSDPNRFSVTITSVPDASGNSTVEQYSALSMNSTDSKFVEAMINGVSNMVTVKRDAAAVFGAGFSQNKAPASLAIDTTHNTIRVSVDGAAPIPVTFPVTNPTASMDIINALNAALGAFATIDPPSGNSFVIRSKSTSDHSSVVVMPGPQNDASRVLGFGAANGGIEADGSSPARPNPSPPPGKLTSAPINIAAGVLNNHPNQSIALTLDGGRPVNIPIQTADLTVAIAAQPQADTFAGRIQTAVRSFRPTVPAFANFMAALNSTTGILTLTSGTRGPASAVAVANAGSDTLAADLQLIIPPATQTAGGSQVLSGGSQVPLVAGNTSATFVPSPASKQGIYALENADIFNILCLPGITDPSTLIEAAAYCESRRAFLIVDPPLNQKPMDIEALVTGTSVPKSDHAAIYYPNIQIGDPLTGGLRTSAPSGTVAGIYARTDGTRGVWKAPAGTEASLIGAQQLEYTMTDGENGIINPVGANGIRVLKPYGIVSWGARTLLGADAIGSQYKYVPVRRLALYIEESLRRGTQWAVFEPNDEPLWSQIRLNVGTFMNTLFRQGAFEGASPRDAYFVKCDHETTQQADIDRGVVNIIVGFAPLKPAEFVMIAIAQIAGQLAA